MTEVVAGWYPDPAGSALSRWWDGTRWTESTMAPNSTSSQQPGWAQPSQQQPGWPPTQTSAYQQQPYGQNPSGQAPYQQAPYGQQGEYQYGQTSYNQQLPYSGGASTRSLWQSNRYTLITVAVAIVYALLGLTTHVALIGIVPILFAVRAFRAKEKLAVLAAVIAGLSVILTIILLTNR